MNAVAFKVLGVSLFTPRLVLFAFFLAWVPTLFYVATRFVGPLGAGLAVLLAVTWSIPNYPAAMPSWYNLFFAVFGLAALLRHLQTEHRRWLFAAGLAGGLSVLMKTAGLFFVAAGLLFLAYREHVLSRVGDDDAAEPRSSVAYSVFSTAALLFFVTLLFLLVGGQSGAVGVLHFIVPLGALSAYVVWSEWSGQSSEASVGRFRALLRIGVPFVAGVLGIVEST